MSAGAETQTRFYRAVAEGDSSLAAEAFRVLDDEARLNENYGESVGGAASCYLVRMGSAVDRSALSALLKKNETALELSRNGLWDEYPFTVPLMVELFQWSDAGQRRDTLDSVAIVASEGGPVSAIVAALMEIEIDSKERRLLRRLSREKPDQKP